MSKIKDILRNAQRWSFITVLYKRRLRVEITETKIIGTKKKYNNKPVSFFFILEQKVQLISECLFEVFFPKKNQRKFLQISALEFKKVSS